MQVKFYGTRGSIPAPSFYGGPLQDSFITAKYGGNTSCVEVRDGNEQIILDAGTGIRVLGIDMAKKGFFNLNKPVAHILISHLHADHIQGVGFFTPLFKKDATFHFYGMRHGSVSVESAIRGTLHHPYFPLELRDVNAKVEFHDLTDSQQFYVGKAGIKVLQSPHDRRRGMKVGRMNHPNGGSSTYRIEMNGAVFVYATDVEIKSSPETREKLTEMCQNADLVVIDAQYTPEEYERKEGYDGKEGWGHNDYETALETVIGANAKKVRIFHHEPVHDDTMLDNLEKRCIEYARGSSIDVALAREGMAVQL